MTAAIETVGLGKCYGKTWALQDCTLDIPAHQVVGLVGPNGAGKTTLLHLAVGLLRPNCGSIQVLGSSPVTQLHLILPRLGFVAQEHPLYRTLTVEDMLVFGRYSNPQWNDAFARSRLAHLGIPLGRSTGTLSGGQQAQVALVLALAKRPELLLLDEPIASLDPLARQTFQQLLMENVAAEGHTVLFSSIWLLIWNGSVITSSFWRHHMCRSPMKLNTCCTHTNDSLVRMTGLLPLLTRIPSSRRERLNDIRHCWCVCVVRCLIRPGSLRMSLLRTLFLDTWPNQRMILRLQDRQETN